MQSKIDVEDWIKLGYYIAFLESAVEENEVFWKKKSENPNPHVKYTKFGEPYLDIEKFYKSDLAKKLEKRSKEISEILERTPTHTEQETEGSVTSNPTMEFNKAESQSGQAFRSEFCSKGKDEVMGKSLQEKLDALPEARQDNILAEANLLHVEYWTLQDLRKAKELTQAQLAEALNVRRATIAQIEKRTDLMLSTLRSYVEAMGGKLSLTVEFPNRMPVSLEGLGDTEEPPRKRKGGNA